MIKYTTKDRPIRDNILLRHRILINKKKIIIIIIIILYPKSKFWELNFTLKGGIHVHKFIVLQFVELPNQPETQLGEKLYTKGNSSG